MRAAPPRLIQRNRLNAPREHVDVLAEPLQLLRDAASGAFFATHAGPDAAIGETTLASLRESLRKRLGWREPVIATGHQAEFFHAGVFAKTIAAAVIAQARGGTAVFLTVDSDTPKTTQIAIPVRGDNGLQRRLVAIPGIDAELPMESQNAVRADAWSTFFHWLKSAAPGPETLQSYRSAFVATTHAGDLSGAFAAAQNVVLSDVGSPPVASVKMSELADGPEFRTFAAHWFANADAFANRYNDAQLAYRQRNKVRNWERPAPQLKIESDCVEMPFWVYRAKGPRCKLFAATTPGPDGANVQLFADQPLIGTLADPLARWLVRPKTPIGTLAILADGWRIRPKALLLSAFARLILGDLFLHGIGGAKYDEMTEDFIRACFGCEPGAMIVRMG